MDYLHIYSQFDQHATAFIIGNEDGLKKLKEMIEDVLKSGKNEKRFLAYDEKDYSLRVVLFSESNNLKLQLPYTDESRIDKRTDVVKPGDFKIKED